MRYLILAVLILFAGPAFAETLTWDPPTTREDGQSLDPATEVENYTLYCVDTSGENSEVSVDIPGLAEETEYEISKSEFLPTYGEYACAMTATDTDGLESSNSNPVTLTWDPAPPNSPTNLLIITE